MDVELDRPPPGQFGPPVPACELQALMDQAGLGAQITGLVWSSRVTMQHRLASRFRRGRLFLAGEAAHAYSPATGQGLNAGPSTSTASPVFRAGA
jgi:2-polyprenyl-6-methoxyphenol hydroxylase-like FAD-dependent oxidoreductase